jgi:hypothetical protein
MTFYDRPKDWACNLDLPLPPIAPFQVLTGDIVHPHGVDQKGNPGPSAFQLMPAAILWLSLLGATSPRLCDDPRHTRPSRT